MVMPMESAGTITSIRSHVYVLLATLLVAGSFLASKNLSNVVNPISLTLLRFLCSVVLLLPFVLFKSKWFEKIKSVLPRAAVMGFFYSFFFICFFESLKTTTALNTGTLYTLVPFFTALLAFFILGVRLKYYQLFVYLLGVLGTCWVVFDGKLELLLSFSLNHGDLIFLLGALSMCCYSVSMKLLYRNDDMLIIVFCTLFCGGIWMLLALLLLKQPLEWQLLQAPDMLNMAYLVLGATILTVYLYQSATVVLGPGRVMAYTYLNPAVVLLLVFLIEGNAVNMIIVPGILLSTLATFLLQSGNKTAP